MQRKQLVPVIAIGLVAAITVGVAVSSARKDSRSKSVAPAAPTAPAASKPDVATSTSVVEVTAGNLYAEYKTNEIGADAKYRDKVLRVTGIVAKVGRNALDEPFVDLQVAGGAKTVRAMFSTETGLAALKPSDTAVARCRGGNELGAPKLTECVLE